MLDHRARTFLAAYRAGSLTQAAKQLHVTQPAVSQHIRQLEAHYGEPLFTKTSRGVEPTAAGGAPLPSAQRHGERRGAPAPRADRTRDK